MPTKPNMPMSQHEMEKTVKARLMFEIGPLEEILSLLGSTYSPTPVTGSNFRKKITRDSEFNKWILLQMNILWTLIDAKIIAGANDFIDGTLTPKPKQMKLVLDKISNLCDELSELVRSLDPITGGLLVEAGYPHLEPQPGHDLEDLKHQLFKTNFSTVFLKIPGDESVKSALCEQYAQDFIALVSDRGSAADGNVRTVSLDCDLLLAELKILSDCAKAAGYKIGSATKLGAPSDPKKASRAILENMYAALRQSNTSDIDKETFVDSCIKSINYKTPPQEPPRK